MDAQIARTLAAELEEWMSRCKHVEEVNDTLRARNVSLMDERDGMNEQMTGLSREVEHQKARVKAYADETDQERSNRVAACRTLTADCNLRGKYIRQLREAIIKLPAPCQCDHSVAVFGHYESCPANIKAQALKLKDDIAEPANAAISHPGTDGTNKPKPEAIN